MSQSSATYIQSHILRRFNIIKKVGSGAYGHVWKVQQKSTKKIYALKKIFDAFQHATDAQRTYRQIQILKQTEHPNIIKLLDALKADNNKDVYLVFQFMEADLHNVISEGILKDVHIRFIIYQMAKALKYLHTGFIIHRDLKPSNVLVNSNCSIKLCDFGLVRSISSKNETGPVLTQGVATRWYRAPQVLLGSRYYSTPADIWSFGCIIFQVIAQKPLFAGSSTLDQLQKICQFTGYPSKQDIKSIESESSKSMLKQMKLHILSQSSAILKDIPAGFRDLILKMIVFNPRKRITIEQVLNDQVVRAFHKPQQQISCNRQITTSIDDNRKFTVDQYRKFIYGAASNADRVNSEIGSVISRSNSAKCNKKTSQLEVSSNLPKALHQKPQFSRKYSQDNLKTINKCSNDPKSTSVYTPNVNVSTQNALKKEQKPTLKYVRSSKQFVKNTNHEPSRLLQNKRATQACKSKSTASLGNYAELNKQQSTVKNNIGPSLGVNKSFTNINKMTYVSKTFYSPKNNLEPPKSINGHENGISVTGTNAVNNRNTYSFENQSKITLNKQTKDKAYLFKSQKYIKDFKGAQVLNAACHTSTLVKKQEPT